MTYDGNRPMAIVTPGPGVASIASRRPFQGFDNISTTKSVGNSSYHSLQVKTERRVASGLSVLGAYTWSKSLSDIDISSVGGGTFVGSIQDYNDLRGNRAPSAFSIGHPISIAPIYDVPLFPSSHGLAPPLPGGLPPGTLGAR